MERMTFYIPPVFLFGNNANRIPYDEEKKSEYKTATETEIKVENWRAKRIAELEEENRKLKEELAHYKNTEAIQKSNNASRYNPYNHKSYVDREFNVIN